MSTPPPNAPATGAQRSRFARLQAATDRVPTKWFAAIGTGLFLAVTAAFGGLAPVAAEQKPLEQLTVGQPHTGAQLAMTVERAVLIDRLSGSGAFPDADEGERLLVLLVEMENRWTEPAIGSAFAGLLDPTYRRNVVLAGDGAAADGIVREDDQTLDPVLQPGVPALIAFSWVVPGDAYRDGEELTVVLKDAALEHGRMLFSGDYWGTPEPAAHVSVEIEDVGAGVAG